MTTCQVSAIDHASVIGVNDMRAVALFVGSVVALSEATSSYAGCQQLRPAIAKYVKATNAALAADHGTVAYCDAAKAQAAVVKILVNHPVEWLDKCKIDYDKNTYNVMFKDKSEVGREERFAKMVCEK